VPAFTFVFLLLSFIFYLMQTTIFNPTYETQLEYIELQVSPRGLVKLIARFIPFLHAKKLYDAAIIPMESPPSPLWRGAGGEVLHIEITDKGPVLIKSEIVHPQSEIPQLPRRFAIYSPPKSEIVHPKSEILCPHCGSVLITRSLPRSLAPSLFCPSATLCPVQKGTLEALQKAHPEFCLSYPMYVLDVPRFIHACNLHGALAWPIVLSSNRTLVPSFYNVNLLAPNREALAHIGFYMGLRENEKRTFERRSPAEIHADTKALLRDYDYI
jgi:hypothetical protein